MDQVEARGRAATVASPQAKPSWETATDLFVDGATPSGQARAPVQFWNLGSAPSSSPHQAASEARVIAAAHVAPNSSRQPLPITVGAPLADRQALPVPAIATRPSAPGISAQPRPQTPVTRRFEAPPTAAPILPDTHVVASPAPASPGLPDQPLYQRLYAQLPGSSAANPDQRQGIAGPSAIQEQPDSGSKAVTGPDRGNAITLDPAGYYYITGSWWTGSNTEVFVAKFDFNCQLVCLTTISNSGPNAGNGIALDPTFGIVAVTGDWWNSGSNSTDMFVAEFDTSCNLLCFMNYHDTLGNSSGKAIAVQSPVFSYVTGCWSNGPYTDAFVAKFDVCALTCMTILPPSNPGNNCGNGIALDSAGDPYITGEWWNTDPDIFVAKFDSACNPLCFTSILNPGPDRGDAIALDPFGNAYVTGNIWSVSPQVFVAAFDPACNLICLSVFFNPGSNAGHGIAYDPITGDLVVTGAWWNSDPDIFVAAVDPNTCTVLCINTTALSNPGFDSGKGIAVDPFSGNAFLTGVYNTGTFTNIAWAEYDVACNLLCWGELFNPN
jgi:hypothetical protein